MPFGTAEHQKLKINSLDVLQLVVHEFFVAAKFRASAGYKGDTIHFDGHFPIFFVVNIEKFYDRLFECDGVC